MYKPLVLKAKRTRLHASFRIHQIYTTVARLGKQKAPKRSKRSSSNNRTSLSHTQTNKQTNTHTLSAQHSIASIFFLKRHLIIWFGILFFENGSEKPQNHKFLLLWTCLNISFIFFNLPKIDQIFVSKFVCRKLKIGFQTKACFLHKRKEEKRSSQKIDKSRRVQINVFPRFLFLF